MNHPSIILITAGTAMVVVASVLMPADASWQPVLAMMGGLLAGIGTMWR